MLVGIHALASSMGQHLVFIGYDPGRSLLSEIDATTQKMEFCEGR